MGTLNKIGFVGLGHMGGSMAGRLMDAGYSVSGTSRTREHAQALIDQGLDWRDSAREVAESTEVLFTSLPDDNALAAASSGPDGVFAGLSAETVWVDVSTVSPVVARGTARRVQARGAAMLAAPVSGSVPQAQSGALTIMVGGDRQAFARVEPILRVLGTVRHVGDNDQALVLKLAINDSLGVQMLAFAEGFLLALRSGIDSETALEVMTSSAIASPMLKARAPLMLEPRDDAWFDIDFMQKDLELALETGRQLQVPLPSAGRADEVLSVGQELGYGRRDISGLFQVLCHMAAEQGMAA
ncbi:MAG TPA: NAD(P)-dependent oxidoreductase [Thermoleophilaceae bacterium]|jgi:3-hydroxyisobutyrate dehydrogenase-like beta-hydroxyacid dehydrogenase